MGGLTVEVSRWNMGANLRDRFMVPAADADDWDRVEALKKEIKTLVERAKYGDTSMYSDVLGCWVKVIEE